MAININTTLTTEAGLPVAPNSMIKPRLHFGNDVLNYDENGNYDGTYSRVLVADLGFLFPSKSAFQADPNNSIGSVQEFSSSYMKQMTDQEYLDLRGNGSLAEEWIAQYLNDILGPGVCTIVDGLAL